MILDIRVGYMDKENLKIKIITLVSWYNVCKNQKKSSEIVSLVRFVPQAVLQKKKKGFALNFFFWALRDPSRLKKFVLKK